MIREILENLNEKVKIYRNEPQSKVKNWAFGSENSSFIHKKGLNVIGIGALAKFVKAGKDNIVIFVDLFSNEKDKGKEFNSMNKNKGETLCRYFTDTTRVSDIVPLCILNADKGYMRFLENIDDDPELEDAIWSKPEYLDHLRTTF